jgi:hypothetical protein
MLEFVRRTWLPTLLFALPILIFELIFGGKAPPPVGTITLISLIVVPPTWWRTAAAGGPVGLGRGAAAGALCGALIVMLPAILIIVMASMRGPGDGSGGLATMVGVFFLVCALIVMVLVGAGLGALTALLQGAAGRSGHRSGTAVSRMPK